MAEPVKEIIHVLLKDETGPIHGSTANWRVACKPTSQGEQHMTPVVESATCPICLDVASHIAEVAELKGKIELAKIGPPGELAAERKAELDALRAELASLSGPALVERLTEAVETGH